MFENSIHQKAYDLLSSGQFRKAHTLLEKKVTIEMGGLIWIDFLYLNTVVHPKRFDIEQLELLTKNKPDWEFAHSLLDAVKQNDFDKAQKLIFDEFETMNNIRTQVLSLDDSEQTLQRYFNLKNKPL